MKQSKTQIHKVHLKKRAILELIGLAILIIFSLSQWPIIYKSLQEIQSSDPLYLSLAVVTYWAALPLTAISFKVLSKKNISIWTNTLAQLAGSGPGRIIPGGLGRLSFSVIHLHKLGIETSKSIIITVTSNIIGVIVTIITIIILSFANENASRLLSGYTLISSILVLALIILSILAVGLWLIHAHRTRDVILKLNRQWKEQIVRILTNPKMLLGLVSIAFMILVANSLILLFCAYALQIDISFSDALLALSAGVFVGGLLPTPGGIGGVEAGITAVLIVFGYSAYESTSVAILFRAITYMQPLIPGMCAYLYLRKRRLL
jgi:uncharacterized protein (TIRG00374 family)